MIIKNIFKRDFFVYYLPILIIECYLLVTIFLYFCGPVLWYIPNKTKLFLFLIISYCSLWIGYDYYIRKRSISVKPQEIKYTQNILASNQKRNIKYIFLFSAIFNIFSLIILYRFFLGSSIFTGPFAPGESYFERLKGVHGSYAQLVTLISVFWVFTYFYLPVGIIYWKKLTVLFRSILLISLTIQIIFWAKLGTLKGLGDLVIISIALFVIKAAMDLKYSKRFEKEKIGNIIKKKLVKKIVFLVTIISIIFILISYIISARQKEIYGMNYEMSVVNSLTRGFVIEEKKYNFISLIFKDDYVIYSLSLYITHGYTGLAYCLDLPFVWTYGVGFSRALSEYVEKYFGIEVLPRSYLNRNQYLSGWRARELWSTVFPWIAGDITFWAIPILMIFIGRLFAIIWIRVIRQMNLLDVVLLLQLFIFAFYIPANNQLFQSVNSFFGVIGLLLMYPIKKIFPNLK